MRTEIFYKKNALNNTTNISLVKIGIYPYREREEATERERNVWRNSRLSIKQDRRANKLIYRNTLILYIKDKSNEKTQ